MSFLKAITAALLTIALATGAHADTAPYDQCFGAAAARYRINEYLLRAIAMHESGLNPAAVNMSNKGQYDDIGLMQVNAWWLENPVVKSLGITREKLLQPCLNIHVGAWILAQEVMRHGNTWEAVGYYNARTESKRAEYILYIQRSLAKVYAAYGIAWVPAAGSQELSPTTYTPGIASGQRKSIAGAGPFEQMRHEPLIRRHVGRIIVVSAE